MLKHLSISNYALIDTLELDLSEGLTIITGETGAGKSIMLGALALLTGGRADNKGIKDKGLKSVIEAQFDIDGIKLQEITKVIGAEDIDLEAELILRREITPAGRSRAFINDTPVNLTLLAAVSELLLDIHSQNFNLQLKNPDIQLSILDSFAGNAEQLGVYQKEFYKYVGLRKQLDTAKKNAAMSESVFKDAESKLAELERLKPRTGEQAELERLFDVLNDAGEIRERLVEAVGLISPGEGEPGALDLLIDALRNLQAAGNSIYSTEEQAALPERLESLVIELKDIVETLQPLAADIEADPHRLEKIEARMSDLFQARKRFQVADTDGLVALWQECREIVETHDSSPDAIKEIERELHKQAQVLKDAANTLSESRKIAARKFDEKLVKVGSQLGLPNLCFVTELQEGKLTANGKDRICFTAAFNKNRPARPIAETASGGEMSRLMLSVKSIMAEKIGLPTVIFDEVDTGVSGEVADKMGEMMKQMAEGLQILAITHLPQVASKGKNHFKVFKTDREGTTVTRIEKLEGRRRVEDIAAMLSGSKVGASAISNAETLLGDNI